VKQAIRNILVLARYYVRDLALIVTQPGFAQKLHARERQVKNLRSRLAKERREVKRLNREAKRLKQSKDRVPVDDMGLLRELKPISPKFGLERGLPIDRYYIEHFLARRAGEIRGRVLEVGDNLYTRKYGGERVRVSDVLDVSEGNQRATVHADLTRADHIPSDAFDCIILTQTLHLIYDLRSAVQTLYRILKPGGVLLATFPGIGRTGCRHYGDERRKYSEHWMLTQLSARRLFEEAFPAANVEVEAHGNVLAAISFLHGLAVEDLRQEGLDYHDPDYQVLIALKAAKPGATS
jgi:SAM-dependent methyltransferase